MKKPFLLMTGNDYYPDSGTSGWIGCVVDFFYYETYEEANKQVEEINHNGYKSIRVSHERDEIYERNCYSCEKVSDEKYVWACDWYKIVDLRDWVD